MDLDNLKPNTDEYLREHKKSDPPQMKPVISGSTAKRAKPSLVRRFVEFASGEDIGTLKQRMRYTVIMWFFDSVHSGIEDLNDLVFNRTVGSKPIKGKRGETSYDKFWSKRNKGKTSDTESEPSYRKPRGEYADLEFDTKWEAQEVYDEVVKYFDDYKVISVANLYHAANRADLATFTDDAYGWYSLNGSGIEKVHGKWYLRMPRPTSLSKK